MVLYIWKRDMCISLTENIPRDHVGGNGLQEVLNAISDKYKMPHSPRTGQTM